MKEMSIDRIIEKETMYFKEEQHKYDCYMDLSDEGKKHGVKVNRLNMKLNITDRLLKS